MRKYKAPVHHIYPPKKKTEKKLCKRKNERVGSFFANS